MADNSRARVLLALEAAHAPQGIDQVADATGLHMNTVRNHLEVLVASGAVQREPLPATGRGRPRFAYRPAGGPSPYRTLASALTAQLSGVGDPSIVEQTALRWAEHLGDPRKADSPGEAVTVVVDELNELGFAAEVGLIGDLIVLRSCPYADLVEGSPMICDIHASLIDRLLADTGQAVSMRALEIEPLPHTCVVRLDRPDLAPERVIEPAATKKATT